MDFTEQDFETLKNLLIWRRDVRRFQTQDVPQELLDEILDVMHLSPSVGNCQPWRWVCARDKKIRTQIYDHFERINKIACSKMSIARREHYASLKLAGLAESPIHYAVYCENGTDQGGGLGRTTMPQTAEYSVVCAIMTFWLAARARGLGVGWVSIIEPDEITEILKIDHSWRLVAYLCVGWPQEDHTDPELERLSWQARTQVGRDVIIR